MQAPFGLDQRGGSRRKDHAACSNRQTNDAWLHCPHTNCLRGLIAGLYAAGELVGGIFYFNYPGGTGLTSGSVFGKIAGASAGAAARS